MLTRGSAILCALLSASLLATSCSTDSAAPTPSTVDPAAAATAAGVLTLKLGTIVNSGAPTADRDQRLADVLEEAATLTTSGVAVDVEIIRIDGIDAVDSAVASLVSRGVTVIAALCDDGSVPPIVDAAVERGLLAVTTCVSLPTPPLDTTSPLFIDLASMHSAGDAVAGWLEHLDAARVATIRSDLLPDVDETCSDVEAGMADRDIALELSVTFTELVDDPLEILEDANEALGAVDAIALCALPPAAGDVVSAIRAAGHGQPIIVPWFTDPQIWPLRTDDVYVVAPSSRHRDDPVAGVTDLLDQIGPSALASDVITVDSVVMLSRAAARVGSVGSSRVADGLRMGPIAAVSSELSLDEAGVATAGRTYRVISITNGRETFEDLVRSDS